MHLTTGTPSLLLVLLLALVLPACNEAPTDECLEEPGSLEVCVTEFGSIPVAGNVELRAGESDPSPITLILDEEGCVSYEGSGTWELRGLTSGGSCVSEWEPVEVVDCQEIRVEVEVMNGCMDGR